MKVCFITPTPMLEEFAKKSTTHLVLAHIYQQDSRYRAFYRERVMEGDFVMLDNSAYELGSSVDVNILALIARELKPSAVFLPDTRFKRQETLRLAKMGIEALGGLLDSNNNPIKLFAVPQGDCLEDIVACYDELVALNIDGFGIYEEVGSVASLGRRWDFLKYLEDTGRVQEGKYYHMLGMEEDVHNISEMGKFPWANSIDSVKPLAYGLYGIQFDSKLGPLVEYPHRQKDYFESVPGDFWGILTKNCETTINWAK